MMTAWGTRLADELNALVSIPLLLCFLSYHDLITA